MLQYYRVDLRDLFDDENPLSPRFVLSLILQLPTDGAFHASRLGGTQFRGWDASRYALVALVNAQRENNYVLTVVNRDPKRAKPKPPEPFPVPDSGESSKAHKPGSFAAVAAKMISAQRRKKELLSGR